MKKKGFTLVELLAVIVILAIVALIVVPVIMGVIKDARKKAAIESFRGYMDAVEKTIIRDSLKTPSELPEKDSNGCYNLNELNPLIKVKGDKPVIDDDEDKLCVENGKIVSISEVIINGYKLQYSEGEILINGSATTKSVKTIKIASSTPTTAKIGEKISISVDVTPSDADRTFTYKSSDTNIATVDDNGVITTKKAGTVTITVTAKNGKNATVTITVKANYKESLLNGTDPVLKTGLVPVTIENNGTVKKADVTEEWYKYGSKKWANAVLLTGSDTYKDGVTIPESAIKAYFVWVPKYSYKLFNMGTYTSYATITNNNQTIDIRFGTANTTNTSTECATPMTSGGSGSCSVGKYMTHPAFISLGVNGIWVGKFEITGSVNAITIKPNSAALRNTAANKIFKPIYNYSRVLDSHLIKNTEWGATAYLSHSLYGINNEIRINNNSNFITGCAASSSSASSYDGCQNAYNTSTGYLASTTGNITGIYDMSGCTSELVASYIPSVESSIYKYGLDTTEITSYSKYFDQYSYSQNNWQDFNYRILGDATGELGPFNSSWVSSWYGDLVATVKTDRPNYVRGCDHTQTTAVGQFYAVSNSCSSCTSPTNTGDGASWLGYRMVLSPQ